MNIIPRFIFDILILKQFMQFISIFFLIVIFSFVKFNMFKNCFKIKISKKSSGSFDNVFTRFYLKTL